MTPVEYFILETKTPVEYHILKTTTPVEYHILETAKFQERILLFYEYRNNCQAMVEIEVCGTGQSNSPSVQKRRKDCNNI